MVAQSLHICGQLDSVSGLQHPVCRFRCSDHLLRGLRRKKPMSALVLGPGRVGRAISGFYTPPAPLLGRQQHLPNNLAADVPVWVCTTNNGLEAVVTHTAPAQRQQLIFVQNGMLLPWLQQHGLQHNTQVLLYMSGEQRSRSCRRSTSPDSDVPAHIRSQPPRLPRHHHHCCCCDLV